MTTPGKSPRQDELAVLRQELEKLRALITSYQKKEAAASDTELRLRAVVDSAPIVLFTTDAQGRFTLSEGRGLEPLGLTPGQVVGLSAFELYKDTPQITENIRRCMNGETVRDVVTVGELVYETLYSPRLDRAGNVVGVDGLGWDVTARFRAEESARNFEMQLLQAQKIETIGTLAGGIAHDFNNILSPILGYTEIAMDLLDADHPARADLEQVLNAAGRARDLVKQILIFARGGDQKKQPIQLHLVVQETLRLIRSTMPTTIEISQRIDTRNDIVTADPAQMHQVIMNLCTNAAHAMRDSGGVLRVELEPRLIRVEDAIPGVAPGQYVVLTVEDHGVGMSKATVARAFEPFFTTKPSGEGTGLGLSVVHGIVQSHGGSITVDSEPGTGSVFRVFLPAADRAAIQPDATRGAPSGGRGEHILVVDDEVEITHLLERLLGSRGYRVTVCTSGESALQMFRDAPADFDAVITDYTMPRTTGLAIARAINRIRPGVPVIIATGYGEKATNETLSSEVSGFVSKPFDTAALTAMLRRVLDEAAGSAS